MYKPFRQRRSLLDHLLTTLTLVGIAGAAFLLAAAVFALPSG